MNDIPAPKESIEILPKDIQEWIRTQVMRHGTEKNLVRFAYWFLNERPNDYRVRYHELLFSVSRKYSGETRHETALRYIHERENPMLEVKGGVQTYGEKGRTLDKSKEG